MMYKKGDTVRIRDDLIVGEEYGLHPIKMDFDMKECLGRTGIVTNVLPEELAVKVNGWWWSEDMVMVEAVPVTNLDMLRKMDAEEAAEELTDILCAAIDAFVDNGVLIQLKSTTFMHPKIKEAFLEYFQAEPPEENA